MILDFSNSMPSVQEDGPAPSFSFNSTPALSPIPGTPSPVGKEVMELSGSVNTTIGATGAVDDAADCSACC